MLAAIRPFGWTRPILLVAAGLLLIASWIFSPAQALALLVAIAAGAAILRYPVVGFVLLAFAVPWGQSAPMGSSSVGATELLAVALGGAWLARAIALRRTPWEDAGWTPYIALFLGAIILSATQATDLAATAREILKWAEMGVVYVAGVAFLRTQRELRAVVAAVVTAGVTQALLGYVQFGLHIGPISFLRGTTIRAYGTFDQPNPYAGYLNVVLAVALAFALRGPPETRRWYGLATLLLIAGLLASESRGAVLAAVVAGSLILASVSRPLFRLWWLGLLAVAAGLFLASYGLVPSSLTDRALSAIGLAGVSFGHVTDANFSAVERAAHWLAGVRMFATHSLLGVGIGNYAAAYPHFHPRGWYAALEHAHNYYINVAAEGGIVGLVAYVLLAGSALWYSCASVRLALHPVWRAAGLGVTGALVATDFHNLFDVLYVHGVTALLGLLMALASAGFVKSPPSTAVESAA